MGKPLKESSKKKITEANTASHNVSWYTDGFLEHSPSRGNLYYKGPAFQKIILVSWGPPSYTTTPVPIIVSLSYCHFAPLHICVIIAMLKAEKKVTGWR